MNNDKTNEMLDAIAIIGLAAKFPGAKNIQRFWENLINAVESISITELLPTENPVNKIKAAGILDDIDMFDASYFGYSPREAEIMDPQQRLMLECAVEALETAGYSSNKYTGRIGVYVGSALSTYLIYNLLSRKDILNSLGVLQVSNVNDTISLPISYHLNLTGPSIDINTTCSSALVAVHQACRSLLGYECDMALAGGVSIDVSQTEAYVYQEGGILSPDGHCRPFDAKAKGTVGGSGLGLVVLKRLEDAISDGDAIDAIIRASAINNDGASKIGFTAPSVQGQANVITEALAIADISADSISYVETHGTGTILGDPIEITALTKAFQQTTTRTNYCAIGSVKSNVGHLNTAAGIVGLIKTILALKHKKIPPSLHFENPNPQINFTSSPFYVNSILRDWDKGDGSRRAGVSSFGMGGTNAHVILEEAPNIEPSSPASGYFLFIFSAKHASALNKMHANIIHYLKNNPDTNLADMAYTLQVGREEYTYRSFVVANTPTQAIEKMAITTPITHTIQSDLAKVAFNFSASEEFTPSLFKIESLYQQETVFRETIDLCSSLLATHYYFNAIQYALAKQLQYWDIRPQIIFGHGTGEYMAACLAGIFDLTDALKLLTLDRQTISKTTFTECFSQLTLNQPQITYISKLTGQPITSQEIIDINYWWQAFLNESNLSNEIPPVLLQNETYILVNLNSSKTPANKQSHHDLKILSLGLTHTEPPFSAELALKNLLGQLWLQGLKINWAHLHNNTKRCRLPLPTYPFQRQRYWIEPQTMTTAMAAEKVKHAEIFRQPLDNWLYLPSWQQLAPLPSKVSKSIEGCYWLLFSNDTHFYHSIVNEVTHSNPSHTIYLISAGTQFTKNSSSHYTINPNNKEDYYKLLAELMMDKTQAINIIYSWGLPMKNIEVSITQSNDYFLLYNFYGILYLIQALIKQKTIHSLQLGIISNQAHQVNNHDKVQPENTIFIGLLKSFAQEYQQVRCSNFDIALNPTLEANIASQIVAEFNHELPEVIVAFRDSYRFGQKFEPCKIEETKPYPIERLRHEGVYIITGGLGQLGLIIAEALAKKYHARLILVTRSAFPKEEHWNELDNDHLMLKRINALKRIKEFADKLIIFQADVAEFESMQRVFIETENIFGKINGVIHAAGDVGLDIFKPIEMINKTDCERQLLPKMQGLNVLQALLEHRHLDFCCLFSSLAAVLGGLGYAAYSAANIYMDSFTHAWEGSLHGTPLISISWDAWQSDTEQNAMINVKEGSDILFCILNSGITKHILVSTTDLNTRIQQWIQKPEVETLSEIEHANISHDRPQLDTLYIAPIGEIEETLVSIWEMLLGIKGIGTQDSFFDLGGHSLLATQLASRIRETFDIEFSLQALFDNPTIADIATTILETSIAQADPALVKELLAEMQD